jgi:hypothetical protein
LVATNFIVGGCSASAIASASRKSFFLALGIGPHILGRHQPGIVPKRLQPTAKMIHPNTGFHADQARRHITGLRPGCATTSAEARSHHADRAYDVKRVLTDIDADHYDCAAGFPRHGVLLFSAPSQFQSLAGLEQRRELNLIG